MDKTQIQARLLALEAHELEDTRAAYEGYVASAHIAVSGAIDDQDQSQAVQARNLSEALEGPLHDHLHKLETLQRIDFGPKTKVGPGALVKLDDRYFVVGVATGPFQCEGVTLIGLSTEAPIYDALADRTEGERFTFRGHAHTVQEVA